MPAPTLAFELRYRRECHHMVAGKMTRLENRDATIPDTPPWHRPLYGSYNEVSAAACRQNEAQLRSGYLDYLFFPEVAATVDA